MLVKEPAKRASSDQLCEILKQSLDEKCLVKLNIDVNYIEQLLGLISLVTPKSSLLDLSLYQ